MAYQTVSLLLQNLTLKKSKQSLTTQLVARKKTFKNEKAEGKQAETTRNKRKTRNSELKEEFVKASFAHQILQKERPSFTCRGVYNIFGPKEVETCEGWPKM